jgi:seryl-tRNA synthetase
MLDIKFMRENPGELKKALEKRGTTLIFASPTEKRELEKRGTTQTINDFVDALVNADKEFRAKIKEFDNLRARRNKLSEMMASLNGADRDQRLEESRRLKLAIREAHKVMLDKERVVKAGLKVLPNIPLPEVPEGKSEADNKVVREVGKKPTSTFHPKDHMELGETLGIVDFERAAKVSGSGFVYLKNEGVSLELALIRYALDTLQQNEFALVATPDLARREYYLGTGYQPRGPEAQTYEIADSDLGLIATAEVTLAGLHADEIIDGEKLPLRYAGYSHCFRQEAGAYGKYSRGLYRLHQFTKVEMFAYTEPKDSPGMHEEFLRLEEEIWNGLNIPYRVVEMCAGDLGTQAARKFDLEAWMPGRGDWGEITSTSNTTDYQARNLNIKYRKKDGKTEYVHLLNGTAMATSRAIVAILENYQQEDGSVAVPKALQKYMDGMKVIQK